MIEVEDLAYVFPDHTVGVYPTNLSLPTNCRALLVGANGAGKSTLMRVLAGKTLAKQGRVLIDGQDPFRDGMSGVAYLGSEWASNPTVRRDIPVHLLLESIGGKVYPDRLEELIDILDIDINWRMHAVSDGERRRVQLAMGLLCPWDTLMLDEVTVDLDVLMRSRFLDYLKKETQNRNCQIIYATHIFDGLSQWPTHVVHMNQGEIVQVMPYSGEDYKTAHHETGNSVLLETALGWLREDLKNRGPRERKPTWAEFLNNQSNGNA